MLYSSQLKIQHVKFSINIYREKKCIKKKLNGYDQIIELAKWEWSWGLDPVFTMN